jgi:hypothetical protein
VSNNNGENGDIIAGGGPRRREYIAGPGGTVFCFRSLTNNCIVVSETDGGPTTDVFLKAARLSENHDSDLADVTREINNHLRTAISNKKDKAKRLSILLTSRGPMLSWVTCIDDDPETRDRAIGVIE